MPTEDLSFPNVKDLKLQFTFVNADVYKYKRKSLSSLGTRVNKVNAMFTNVNAAATMFGGDVSRNLRCAAPTVRPLNYVGSSVIVR